MVHFHYNNIKAAMKAQKSPARRPPGRPRKNYAVAVNRLENTTSAMFSQVPTTENSVKKVEMNSGNKESKETSNTASKETNTNNMTTATTTPKRKRGRPRKSNIIVERVKYDMEQVGAVEKKDGFWNSIETWPPRIEKQLPPANSYVEDSNMENDTVALQLQKLEQQVLKTLSGSKKKSVLGCATNKSNMEAIVESPPLPERVESGEIIAVKQPLLKNTVLYIPSSRQDWENSVGEMVALCTSASYRQYCKHDAPATPFTPPLSKDYIRDRVDIDDPLKGYQLRSTNGGHLQGFILYTNFTVWNEDFQFQNGEASGVLKTPTEYAIDSDNSLATALQAQPRHGDMLDTGEILDGVAEIGLLGGLGCGEILLRMAIEDIRRQQYKFIVLQATQSSRSFYERFGFKRVGAVCRYPNAMDGNENELQGYRHWTHLHESQQSIDLHGGESYMMALKLPDASVPFGNLLETMKSIQVHEKPLIETLGHVASPTPSKKGYAWTDESVPKIGKLDLMMAEATESAKQAVEDDDGNNTRRSSRAKRPAEHLSVDTFDTSTKKKRRTVSKDDAEPKSASDNVATATNAVEALGPVETVTKKPAAKKPPLMPKKRGPGRPRKNTKPVGKQPKTSFQKLKESTKMPMTLPGLTKASSKSIVKKEPAKTSTTKRAAKKQATLQPILAASQVDARTYLEHSTGKSISQLSSMPIISIDPKRLCKQKLFARDKTSANLYSRIVKRKNDRRKKNPEYFFVLDFDADSKNAVDTVLIPVQVVGAFKGARAGRPRYKCALQEDSSNWTLAKSTTLVEVPAKMVFKSAWLHEESFDIQDE